MWKESPVKVSRLSGTTERVGFRKVFGGAELLRLACDNDGTATATHNDVENEPCGEIRGLVFSVIKWKQ